MKSVKRNDLKMWFSVKVASEIVATKQIETEWGIFAMGVRGFYGTTFFNRVTARYKPPYTTDNLDLIYEEIREDMKKEFESKDQRDPHWSDR